MIRKFEWIKDSGNFTDYRWSTDLPDLKRINVIYGSNGSGKTSLTHSLDALRSMPNGFANVSIQVEQGSVHSSTRGLDDPFFDRMHVFGEKYVERSHRFHEGSPNMDAILTLGSQSAEVERRIEELGAELITKGAERDTAKDQITSAERDNTAILEQVSAAVVSDLSRIDGYRSRSSYSAGTVRAKYNGDRTAWILLDDVDLASKKRFVASDNREELDRGSFDLKPDDQLKIQAEELLSKTPVTIVLDTLNANSEASNWVQVGVSLHEHSSVCLFCGQSLPAGRLQDIERHFSDEVASLQEKLDSLDGLLQAIDLDVVELVRRVPVRGLLFDDLRSDFDRAAKSLQSQTGVLKDWIETVRKRLQSKRLNVLDRVDSKVPSTPAIDGSDLETVRDLHNDRVIQHTPLLASTAIEIEHHHLKISESSVDTQKSILASAESKRSLAQNRIEEIQNELARLVNVQGDPTPSAEVLTREVARLLGRDELTFQARDGRYVVVRDSHPAIGLSVGERSAIVLVHFLEEVARHDLSKGKPIVVIDDPVSSLDSNVFMGISTYIWSETVAKDHVEQLILLTHNFDLFRQWDVQIESMHKGGGMKRSHPAELYELKTRHITANGKTRRRPVLVSWPENEAVRKKIRSSYHHAFIAVADAKRQLAESDSIENRLDAQLLFPNVIRKILETFLAFKRPEWVGDFTDSMRKAGQLLIDSGYTGDADALRQQLTRYSHAYSHSQTPETDITVNPDEIGSAISSVFVFMHQIDREHFLGLCGVVGIPFENLLPASPAT